MDNEQLALEGFLLCEGSDDCDFCRQIANDGNLFWLRTSYEYTEGNHYCRSCAIKQIEADKKFVETGIPHYIDIVR